MSGEQPDLAVPPSALAEIANGINLAHTELQELGMIGEASVGRGFSDLALSGLELGHGGLTSEFGTFCERWEWGVRALTLKGNVVARALGLSVGSFAEQERYVKDSIKIGVNSVNGNPHLSEDEVKQMSWDTIRDQHMWDNADWSGESMAEAHAAAGQTWRDTGYAAMDGQVDQMEAQGLISPERADRMDAQYRDLFDPSEGAIAQAEEQRWWRENR